jgi:hypothetical protein
LSKTKVALCTVCGQEGCILLVFWTRRLHSALFLDQKTASSTFFFSIKTVTLSKISAISSKKLANFYQKCLSFLQNKKEHTFIERKMLIFEFWAGTPGPAGPIAKQVSGRAGRTGQDVCTYLSDRTA